MLEMDGSVPIEQNREALKRILAMLVAMAELGSRGLGAGGQFTFFPQKGAAVQNQAQAEKSKLSPALTPAPSPALTLPRHVYRAMLLLLRPAESAARRLIIAAARGIVVALPPPRKPKPKPPIRGPRAFMPVNPKRRRKPALRSLNLSLLDPLKRYFRIRRRYVPAHAAPRIRWLGGFDSPFLPRPPPPPAPPSPDDPIDAARLGQRLAVLGAALDDLPDRHSASPAGGHVTTPHLQETAKLATPQSLRASMAPAWCRSGATRRCGGDARPAAGWPATTRPRPIPAGSARSTRSWRTPTRWPSSRWTLRARTRHDARPVAKG